uniref:RNA helicase n=1 Tax=Globodera rostochiensis TaxID=31243 RepID=A0A914HX97_GLORO
MIKNYANCQRKSDRNRERSSRRSRSRSRSPRERDRRSKDSRTDRERDRDLRKRKVLDIGEIVNIPDKSKLNEKLDEEIRKRREKVERWREQQKKLQETKADEADATTAEAREEKPSSSWTLEGEDDEEEEEEIENGNGSDGNNATPANGESVDERDMSVDAGDVESELDPLDAYMAEISHKNKGGEEKKARVLIIGAVSKSAPNKGDILEPEEETVPITDELDIEQTASSLLAKGRMLPQTDHTKVYYREFRKDFYVEVAEIAQMSKKEVDEYRQELDEINVRGKNVPKPIKNWSQCGVDLKMLNLLKLHNYTKPTPIQAQAIPSIMSGRDLIGIAKTGSGKTLAFLIPMFRHVMDQERLYDMDGPIAMIMSPTRELALQTWKEANKFARNLGLHVN